MNLAFPRSVGFLFGRDPVVQSVSEGEPQFVALAIHHLAVVQVRVMPVPERCGRITDVVQRALAVLQHLWNVFAVIVACVVQGRECRRCDGWATAAGLTTAVADAAIGVLAPIDVILGLLDHLAANRDACVAATAKTLDLGDCGAAFVEVVAFFGGHIAPATGRCLGVAAELNGSRQNIDQFFPPIEQAFFAENLGQEQHRKAVPVGVPGIGLRVADQAIAARLADDEVSRSGNLTSVRSLGRCAAAGDHGRSRQRCHRSGIDSCIPLPAGGLLAG